MELYLPFPKSTISQGFGQNFNSHYKSNGLKGHTGIDFAVPYDTPILNCTQSYVYSTINKDNPNLMFYRAVFTLIHDNDFSYEVSYGHCSTIAAQTRTVARAGQVLGAIGNSGTVFTGGMEVTKEQKDAGSKAGSHLHFQVRKARKVLTLDSTKQYLSDGNGILNTLGYYYEVVDYDNGYHGCVDPTQFFNKIVISEVKDTVDIIDRLSKIESTTTNVVVKNIFMKEIKKWVQKLITLFSG